MRRYLVSILLMTLVLPMMAQSARDYIRLGNRAYRQQQYEKAETYYLKSIAKSPSFEGYYNLGNAYVMQEKDSTAFDNYRRADSIGTNDPMRKARNFHNMGNIWYAQGMGAVRQQGGNPVGAFQRAVEFYKSSLRCNPNDDETRYNLAMAQYQLKKNQDKQKNDGGGNDDDQNKDQQKKNQQDKQDQNQQKQNKDQQQEQDKSQQQESQPKKDDMSDQAAEQLLNSAQQDEKSVQRKLNKQQNNRRRSLEKDW